MKKQFNPEMLQLARELRELTQTELANLSNMSQGFLSLLEAGAKDASEDRLLKIAEALNFPVDFFFQQDRYTGLGMSVMFFRKKASAQVGDLRKLQAEICLRRIQISRLLRGLNVRTSRTFSRMDIDSHEGPEQIAELARASWQIPIGPVRNLVSTIESAGGIVIHFDFGTSDVDAVSQWPDDAPPFFFINSRAPADRIRFSLAHELGHVLMHTCASDTMEDEANRFAAEFLMPGACIAPDLTNLTLKSAAAMKPYWRVSMWALIHRAHALNKIGENEYRSLCRRMSQLGYRRSEPCPISPEPSVHVNNILNAYQSTNGYGMDEMSRLSFVHRSDFEDRYVTKPGLRLVS
jgi:Zn-dependent peptidase ImmA (M78 family)/transcriptional regulator with XRE-family HTH domain